jgi:hypothetical protein
MKSKIECPFCQDVAVLSSNINDVYVGKIKSKIWVNFISYQCDSCEESFTNAEVDELNLLEINRGVKKFQRMIKINNVLK